MLFIVNHLSEAILMLLRSKKIQIKTLDIPNDEFNLVRQPVSSTELRVRLSATVRMGVSAPRGRHASRAARRLRTRLAGSHDGEEVAELDRVRRTAFDDAGLDLRDATR